MYVTLPCIHGSAVSPFISPARKNVRPIKGQDHLDLEDPPALLWSSRENSGFCSVHFQVARGGGGSQNNVMTLSGGPLDL